MSSRAKWAQSLLFLIFIGAFFLLNLILPDRGFSEQENRYLQTAPRFSFSSLFSGKFTSDFESYLPDQFAVVEKAVLLQEDNAVILFISPEAETMLSLYRAGN